ncbi:hypothetical protein GCM10027512_22390 [Chromohalobacter beijerinckii]
MIIFTVELHQFRLEVGTYAAEQPLKGFKMLGTKEPAPILGNKDQVCVEHENAVSAGSVGLLVIHRPSIF